MKKIIHTILTPKILLALLLIDCIFLIGGAFYIEHVLDVAPCKMCWWQRYDHWFITAVVLLGMISKKHILALWGVIAGSLVGTYLAIWHTLVQQKIIDPPGCGDVGDTVPLDPDSLMNSLQTGSFTLPSCDSIDFTIFGLSLANLNIVAMLAFALVASFSIWYNHHK
jgi:disulfide bond formation protein DsbB